jgi:hypothetical protein
MDNLKMSPPCGGDIALQSPYEDTAPVPAPKSYLATRTSDEQTTRMVGKLSSKTEIKDFLSHLSHKTQNQRFGSLLINADFLRECGFYVFFSFAQKIGESD